MQSIPNIQNAIKSSLARLAMDKKRPDEKFLSADKRKMIMKSKYFESCIKLDTRLRISYPNITSHDYFDSWHIANSLGFVDYVVVDAKWAEIIKQTKLDSKYSIKVFSAKPNSLKEFFKELKSL